MAEKMEAEKSLAKQKEALKGKVASVTTKSNKLSAQTNNTGTKSSTPAAKKQLTVETDHNLNTGSTNQSSSSDASSKVDSENNSDN